MQQIVELSETLSMSYNKVMVTVGNDEVGRGCWAGPLVAGAVILNVSIDGLKDSKQLTKLQRGKLSQIIADEAAAVGLGWVWPQEIDAVGLTEAVRLAMQRALAEITLEHDAIIIDGSFNFLQNNPKSLAVIKADNSIPAVSAASIVAKVARDNFMHEVAVKYPEYGFDKHVGYGTSLHQQMLKLYGISDIHRKSFRPIQALLQLAYDYD
jgi:ribonuclease HII